MRYKEAFPGACVAQEGQVGPWTAEWLGGSGCSGDVQYLVGDGVGWALVCIVATEFDEDDGPGGDVDGGDAGDGGISGCCKEVGGYVFDAVGRSSAGGQGHGLDGQASGSRVIGGSVNKLVDGPVIGCRPKSRTIAE